MVSRRSGYRDHREEMRGSSGWNGGERDGMGE